MLYIFDKDGTICRSKSGQKFINSVDDQELISGVSEKIRGLKEQGHKIAIASNQGGVAFDIISFQEAQDIVQHAAELIGANDWRFSPFHPKGNVTAYAEEHQTRKPNPGMIEDLIEQFIEVKETTIFIGDRPEDKQAAENAGVKFVWADEFFKRN